MNSVKYFRVSVVVCVLLAACSPLGRNTQTDITFLDGTQTTLEEHSGDKTAVINFWAAWCPFCKEELPLFQKMHEKYPEIAFIGVNLQEDQQTAEKYWTNGGYTFRTLLDPKETLKRQFDVFTQPTTFFLDEDGDVIFRKDGPLHEKELEERIQELLKGMEGTEDKTDGKTASGNIQTSLVPPHLRSWYAGNVRHTIPLDGIISGGPPKDGIPSIDDPSFISIHTVDFLDDDSPGVLLSINGDTRFYPFAILNWHEIVNDTVGGEPVAVTYCPLCATAVTYSRKVSDSVVEFGVSGLLYQSNLLMYDRSKGLRQAVHVPSLWSQITAQSVVGPLTGEELDFVRSDIARFGWVKTLDQSVKVLSTDTGHTRNYRVDPYAGYEDRTEIFFPVATQDDRLHPKDFVYGIVVNGIAKAYTKSALQEHLMVNDDIGGVSVRIEFDPSSESLHIQNMNIGLELIPIPAFWFSWVAQHPDTLLYQ